MESKSFHLQLNWNQNRIEKKDIACGIDVIFFGW